MTDGTSEGTHPVMDLVPGPESSEPMGFARLDSDRVFLFAGDAARGREPRIISVAHLGAVRPRPVRIATGLEHAVAVKEDGTVWTWGRNFFGQLGDGTTAHRSSPAQVQGLSGFAFLAGGENHSAALAGDGTVWTWGTNDSGALGEGTPFHRATPAQALGFLEGCSEQRGMTWVQSSPDDCVQTRVICDDCDPYEGDTSCSEAWPLLCIKPKGLASCASDPVTSTDGWTGGTVALTSFRVPGTHLTSLATANALCATTFGAGYRMAEFHDGDGGWGWRAQGAIKPLSTAASTHPRFGNPNLPDRFWVHIDNQLGNCWD